MLEDVEDGYVSVARAAIDYGVVIEEVDRDLAESRIDQQATERSCAWSVVLDWGTGELLPRTTEQYRDTLRRRSAACWS